MQADTPVDVMMMHLRDDPPPVSDFRSDITSGKWQKYLDFSTAVVFAVPKGLVSKDDIPKGCGLMTRGENGWVTLRKPTRQTVTHSTVTHSTCTGIGTGHAARSEE